MYCSQPPRHLPPSGHPRLDVPVLRPAADRARVPGIHRGTQERAGAVRVPPPRVRAQPDGRGPDAGAVGRDRGRDAREGPLCVLRQRVPGLRERRPRERRLGGAGVCPAQRAPARLPGACSFKERRARRHTSLTCDRRSMCTARAPLHWARGSVVQSFAKNAGLYGERVGALHVVAPSKEAATRIKSQLSVLARAEISNPPAHGARLVSSVLCPVPSEGHHLLLGDAFN